MDNSYEIIIKNETNDNNKSPVAGSGAQSKRVASSGGSDSGSAGSESSSAGVEIAKGLVSYNRYIKPFVNAAITQRINTVSLRTGAEELEERLAFKHSMISKGVGLLESVAIGAVLGGGVPGAVLGAVISFTTMAVEYSNKAQQLSWERSVESIGLEYMNARAGGSVASFSRSRMKNQ